MSDLSKISGDMRAAEIAEMFKNFKDAKSVPIEKEIDIGGLLNGFKKAENSENRNLSPEEAKEKLKKMLEKMKESEKEMKPFDPFEGPKEDIQLYRPELDPGPKKLPFYPGDDKEEWL